MVQYHFRTKEGPSVGPIDADEFRRHLEAREITDATLVWRSGLIDWTNYAALRAFEEELARKQATPPPLLVPETSQQCEPVATASPVRTFPAVASTSATVRMSPGTGEAGRMREVNASPDRGTSKAKGGGVIVQILGMVGVAVVCCGLLLGALWLRYYMSKGSRVVRQEARFTAVPGRR